MKIFLKITKIFLNIITTFIIIFGILFIGLFLFGIQPYVVESGSMEPAIETGSVCFINKRALYDDMKVGDIIAFKIDEKSYATHRINSISENGFITKGDANKNEDVIVTTRDNFIGKNIFSVKKIGYFIKNTQTPSGKIIMITLIITLLLAGILIGEPSKKGKNKSEDKIENKTEK